MNTPTRKELYHYIDGLLPDDRRREVEKLAAHDPVLQKEIAFLRRLEDALQSGELTERPSAEFTDAVMDAIAPVKKDSWVFILLKNSSNVLAMIIVLALIGVAYQLFSVEPLPSSSGLYSESLTALERTYSSAAAALSAVAKEYWQPLNASGKQGTMKIIGLGVAVLLMLGFFDELFGKRILK